MIFKIKKKIVLKPILYFPKILIYSAVFKKTYNNYTLKRLKIEKPYVNLKMNCSLNFYYQNYQYVKMDTIFYFSTVAPKFDKKVIFQYQSSTIRING